MLATPLAINGNGASVSGNSQYRVFFSDGPTGSTTSLSNLTIRDGYAHGGNGGYGGGGGGLGAGGGLFVARGNVTLTSVSFSNNKARGGYGGGSFFYYANVEQDGGGGGGLGGQGYSGFDPSYGAGGGLYGSATLRKGGGSDPLGPGTEGGSGFAPAFRYGGGYLGDGAAFGGGGGSLERGGNGGFGGGGGGGGATSMYSNAGLGGNGGFGGGGGGTGGLLTNAHDRVPGLPGAFAGNASASDPFVSDPKTNLESDLGGGGAALGGNLFAAPFAGITINDSTVNFGTVEAGPGGQNPDGSHRASDGSTAGASLFLAGQTRINVSTGQTRQFNGAMDDVGDYLNAPTAFGYEYGSIIKGGPGDFTLSGTSSYRGGTVISQGTVNAATGGSAGTGVVTLNDANTGAANTKLVVGTEGQSVSFSPNIVVAPSAGGTATLASAPVNGGNCVFAGSIQLNGPLTLLAQDTFFVGTGESTASTIVSGAIHGSGDLTITGATKAQFYSGIKDYTGRTTITGNTTLSLADAASSPTLSSVQVNAGSSLLLESGVFAAVRSLEGAGSVKTNGGTATLHIGSTLDAGIVHTFTGTIPDAGNTLVLDKVGSDIFVIGAQTNRRLNLSVSSGLVRAAGDMHIYELDLYKPAAGQQSFDLAGHLLDVTQVTIPPTIVGNALNAAVGDASDGIYDSANADPRKAVGVAKSLTTNLYTVRTTWKGDANLDSKVDFDDLLILARNYNQTSGLDWSRGDYDRDGTVNFNDLLALARNYNVAAGADAMSSDFASDWALAQSLVPEPTVAVALAATLLVPRRSRR